MTNFDIRLRSFLSYFAGKTKYGAMAAIATPIIIIISTYMACRYAKRACKSKHEGVLTRSMSIGSLHGGKRALARLIDFRHALADPASLNAAESELKALLAADQPDFNKLQSCVSKLEMSGKESVAVEILEKALEKAIKEEKSHEAYEIEMMLVEMLIYKGDYDKALNCNCLSHEEISDARRPLYKASIHIMLNRPKEEASKCWEEFKEVRTHFQSPPGSEEDQVPEAITHFHEFDNVVKMLNKAIKNAHYSNVSI